MISRGLALPDLDQMGLSELIARAISDHEQQTGMTVDLTLPSGLDPALDYAQKLCVFRFLQETLSNATRHADVTKAEVRVEETDQALTIVVTDHGVGFDASVERKARADGGLGLFGMTDRAESIGGSVDVQSQLSVGSTITLTLPKVDPTK